MNILKFNVIIVNNIVLERRMPLPDCFPQWMMEKLGQYVSIRSRNSLSWMVTVETDIEKNKEPLVDEVVAPMESTFTKIMTASDISGRQTIGIPLPFIRRNWAWFNNCYERCRVVVDGERSEECRISWHFREGRWEGVICSGGWKYAVKKFNPSKGDVVEFKLPFHETDKMHHFNTRVLHFTSA
ncbi:hypothetical protein ACFE04_021062 [Oxalis oulophora]